MTLYDMFSTKASPELIVKVKSESEDANKRAKERIDAFDNMIKERHIKEFKLGLNWLVFIIFVFAWTGIFFVYGKFSLSDLVLYDYTLYPILIGVFTIAIATASLVSTYKLLFGKK